MSVMCEMSETCLNAEIARNPRNGAEIEGDV